MLNINLGLESMSFNAPIQDVMDRAAGAALCSFGRVCLVNEEKAGGGREGERESSAAAQQQRARHQLPKPRNKKANLSSNAREQFAAVRDMIVRAEQHTVTGFRR